MRTLGTEAEILTIFLALAGFALAGPPSQAGLHRFTLDDLLSVEPLGETVLSPDGKTFALTQAGQIVLLSAEGGWPIKLTTSPGSKTGLSWSPDSRRIAYSSQNSIWTVSIEGGQPMRLTRSIPGEGDPRQAGDHGAQWSPKGKWVLFETGRRGHDDLVVVREDGRSENYITQSSADATGGSWSHDGTRISYTERSPEYFSGQLKIVKFDPESGIAEEPVTLYTSPTDRGGGWSIRKSNWSPDDHTLAVVLQDSGWDNIYLITASGGAPRQLTHGDYEDVEPVFSPDGKSLAVVSNRTTLEETGIWIVPVDGSTAHPLTHFTTPGVESSPTWSPDGSKIYFHRNTPIESTELLVAYAAGSSGPTYLTHTMPKNLESALKMPEKIQYRSKDGKEIAAILYKPHNFQARDSLSCSAVDSRRTRRAGRISIGSLGAILADQGYLVLEPNYGSYPKSVIGVEKL